jgi:hypothetical protein
LKHTDSLSSISMLFHSEYSAHLLSGHMISFLFLV